MRAHTPQQYTAAAQALAEVCPPMSAMTLLLAKPAADAAAARDLLGQMVGCLRDLDLAQGGGHTRAADVLTLYASTQVRSM